MDLENWTYPYRLRTSWALFLMLASVGLIYVGYDNTFYDQRGLVIGHVIHLGPAGARVFWACLGLTGVAMLMVTLWSVYLNMTAERNVVLRVRAMTLPRHRFSSVEVTIPYRDIQEVRLVESRRQKYFTIRTADRKIMVQSIFLPSTESFIELYEEIGARARRAERSFGATGLRA